jgi:hypothetical protein
MEGSRGANGSRHLRAVGAAALEPAALAEEILACLAGAPGGIPVRALPAALAERLAMSASELPSQPVETALGLLIAGGRVDERAGRLVPVSEEQRRAV